MKHKKTVDDIAAINGNWDTKFFRMTDHAKKLQFDLFMALACLEQLTRGVEAAIEMGDWKVDGRCDPDAILAASNLLLKHHGMKKDLDTFAEKA